MKEIALTQGKVAIGDNEDYDWLSQWKWRLQGQGVRSYHNYAVREVRKRGLPDHVFEHLLTMARRGR
jgi:hypothetical protein